MTTVEMLLVQIFERKKSIIEQVKQQAELYSQHLASKLLIDGITPPSWLWNPSTSDSEELNKEELISKLLCPNVQPSARCSFAHYPGYNNMVIADDNDEFCDRAVTENPAINNGSNRQDDLTVDALSSEDLGACTLNFAPEPDDNDEFCDRAVTENPAINNGSNRQDDLTVDALSSEDLGACALNFAPEPDASVTSPEDQTDERILNILSVSNQSLAGIQRSKSRQRALELRSSAKALAKSRVRCENINDTFSSQIRFSLSATDQAGQDDEVLQLAEPCVVGCQGCEDRDFDEAEHMGRETGMDAYSDRITMSKSCTEVPISVDGSLTFGCSSKGCKENAPIHGSKARRMEFMPISDFKHADNYVYSPRSAGPSTVCCESCKDRRADGADCLCKDKDTNVYTDKITRSKNGEWKSCGFVPSKSGSSSDYCRGTDIAILDSEDSLPRVCVDGTLVKVNSPNDSNEDCETRESISEELKRHKESDVLPSRSSIQYDACVDKIYDLEVSSLSAKVDEGILVSSSVASAREVNDSHEVPRLVIPFELFRRLPRSQTRSDDTETYKSVAYDENPGFSNTISNSDCKRWSAKEELQNTSSDQSAPACCGTHSMLLEEKTGSLVRVGEPVLHDHVHHSFSSSSRFKQTRELESQDAPTRSDSCVFVVPKQFYCNEIDEYNVKAVSSESGKRRLDNWPEKMSCSFSAPDVSDKGICGVAHQLSLGKQSPAKSAVSSKSDKMFSTSFGSDVQEIPGTQAEKFGPVISATMLEDPADNSEVGLNCKAYEVHHEVDNKLSVVDIPDTRIHPVQLNVQHMCESSPEWNMEEGDWSGEEKSKGQLVSTVPAGKISMLSRCYSSATEPRGESCDYLIRKVEIRNAIELDEINQFPAQQSQLLSCIEGEDCAQHEDSTIGENVLETSGIGSHSENSLLERSFSHTSMKSWPQIKRRKTEHQQAHSFTTSPSFQVKRPHSIRSDAASRYLKTTEINLETAFMEYVNKSIDVGICPEMDSNLMEQTESPILSQHGQLMQVGSHKGINKHRNSSSGINHEQLEARHDSSLTMNSESGNSQGCFLEETRTSLSSSNLFDARLSGNEQCSSRHLSSLEKNADNLISDKLKLSNILLEGIQSPKQQDGLYTEHSQSNEDLQQTDVDQSIPVFEGFIVGAQTDSGELKFAADAFDFDQLNLPMTTLERDSVLAEICRSASLDRPSCQFSSALEFQGTQNLFHSVPNGGHLEHLDLGDNFPLNSDVGKPLQLGSSSSDDYKDAIDGIPCSVSLAYSGARFGWNSRNQHASPVGNLWDRLSSHTGSSEKRLSSNPELTCFPIEEDHSISEENRTVDEKAGDGEEEIDSLLANHCDIRQPLKDLTNLSFNMPVSAEETLNTDGVDFVSTKFSVSGTEEKVHLGPKFLFRNKSETSEKQTSFAGTADGRKNQFSHIGTNGIKKAKESIKNSISKPIVSNKTSLKGQNQKLSLKESTRNNIVSNVSSFIPLVQQKQAAKACAGKRDVKVKALEAAEAAKRLEKKKENERKLRKEALKLERAKLEEKNLRNIELEKKRKEEECKKKDADIIAKKRLREEEEKKERNKKRMRIEARHRQREEEEKKRADKIEKESQRFKDEQMNSKKESLNEPKKKQNKETSRGDEVALQKAETKLTLAEVINNEEHDPSGLSYEAEKEIHAVDKSPRNEDLIAHNNQGKSYEISPYQCSDDEDEEEDELPTKKYIPSWASKSSVALFLPLQQKLDPDVIFPPESFCSMDEVLLPRKLRQS